MVVTCHCQVLVERLRWVSGSVYLELLALCQCLPGPTSTQLSFAMGNTQQGVLGGLLSGGFPSELLTEQQFAHEVHLVHALPLVASQAYAESRAPHSAYFAIPALQAASNSSP